SLYMVVVAIVHGYDDGRYAYRPLPHVDTRAGLARPRWVHAVRETGGGAGTGGAVGVAAAARQAQLLGPGDVAAPRGRRARRGRPKSASTTNPERAGSR